MRYGFTTGSCAAAAATGLALTETTTAAAATVAAAAAKAHHRNAKGDPFYSGYFTDHQIRDKGKLRSGKGWGR